jgi:hypothetical protein
MQSFALDTLKLWLHPKLKATKSGSPTRGGSDAGDPIRTFGLPPARQDKGRGQAKSKREPPTAKEFAISLLHAGAEIEHSLLVQYLYAAYSINERAGNKRTNLGLKWKTNIRLIAREEMAHLVTVQNLLLSLGAGTYLNRGPLYRAGSSLPLPFKLERLSLTSISKYVLFESPSPSQMDEKTLSFVETIREKLGKEARILSVASIYAALYWLFMKSDEPDSEWPFSRAVVSDFIKKYGEGFHLEDGDFLSTDRYSDRAATAEEWGIFENDTRVGGGSPRVIALANLRWIMAQGEGPNAIEDAHFFRFIRIYKELKSLGAKSAAMRMRVPSNPHVQGLKNRKNMREAGTTITNRRSKLWGRLSNARYQLMVLHIFCSLGSSRTRMTQRRKKFAHWAITEMEFVKKIGQMLPFMFLAKNGKERAGAVFQSVFVPLDESGRGEFRRHLLDLSDACISSLRNKKMPEYTDDAPTTALEPSLLDSIARQNDEVREMLRLL